MLTYHVLFVTNSFYLAVTADTDPAWVERLIELGALVKTDLKFNANRHQQRKFIAVYLIDESRAKDHIQLPPRPHIPAQYSVSTKPNLN